MDPQDSRKIQSESPENQKQGENTSTEAIVDVLVHLHSHPPDHVPADGTELDGWSVDQLKAELLRLRRSTGHAPISNTLANVPSRVSRPNRKRATPRLEVGGEGDGMERGKRSRVRAKAERDEGTGKRVEKGRRTELGKAIRTKMRFAIHISPEDPLPAPTGIVDLPGFPASASSIGYAFVPNWLVPNEPLNTSWVEKIANQLLEEVGDGELTKIPPDDLDPEVVSAAAKTAFLNFCKRYMTETDPGQAVRKERYAKGRRRWARKDLKQKKRAKASLDPLFTPSTTLPPSALHIDYMSSEYSSVGEDSSAKEEDVDMAVERNERWETMLSARKDESGGGKGGWAEGLAEKVLEVRTPRWRSEALNKIYRQLDTISSQQANARSNPAFVAEHAAKAGHVAPSHRRFAMPRSLTRRGRNPRGQGEGWMWATGEVGLWPDAGQPEQAGFEEDGIGDEVVGQEGWRDEETRGLVNVLQGIQGDGT